MRTFAILATTANAIMQQLHDRMPVILEPEDWPAWLGKEPDANLAALFLSVAVDALRLWPVSRAANSVWNNGPELRDRIDDPHAPPPSDTPAGENPT